MIIWEHAGMAEGRSLTENSRYPTYSRHGLFRLFPYTPYLSDLCSELVRSAIVLEAHAAYPYSYPFDDSFHSYVPVVFLPTGR